MLFEGPDGYAAGLEALARVWAPARPLSTSAWAARYRRLSGKSASEPGPWRNERIPFLAAVMDALDPRHPAPLVVFAKSSQVGGSESGLNWIGRTLHQAPGSFLCLFPTDKVARKWVRTRLDSMIATTPELRSIIPLGRRSNSGNTLSEKSGPGFVLYTGSANIPDDVASISVPYLFFDEVDRMPDVLEGEGDPIELALRRSTTFPRSKAFMVSTPTTFEKSRIWRALEASTWDRFFVPCVHCGHMQFLRWAGVQWLAGKPQTACYACEECGATIEERHKTDMLAAGDWRATFPEREAEVKGFHVNGLYTPIGLGDTWAKHVAAFERAQGSQARLQVFYNTRLGEVHKGERKSVDWKTLHGRREAYRLRTIPRGVLILTSGTDVQANRLETQVIGWGRNERATVVDYVVHEGDPTRPEVWQALDAYLAFELLNEFGVRMRLSSSLVDSGYLPDEVMSYTRERDRVSRKIFAARGSHVASRQPIGRPTRVDVKRKGEADKRGAERYEVGVTAIKHWLFERLRSDDGTDDAPVLPADRHVRFSEDLPDEYYKQLCAETFDPVKGWIARANYHRNEALDTFVLARAAALHHSVALHRLRELDWQRLESTIEPAVAVAAPPTPKLGAEAIQTAGGFIPTAARVKPST